MHGDGEQSGETDPLAAAVGARVAALRAARNWEPSELARRTGMSDKYIWRIENGQLAPGLRNLARLAAAFDLTLSGLLKGVAVPEGMATNRPYVATRKPGRPKGPTRND